MKLFSITCILGSWFTLSAVAAPLYFVEAHPTSIGAAVMKVDIKSKKEVHFSIFSEKPAKLKLGTDGFFHGFTTFSHTDVSLKISSDQNFISYKLNSPYHKEWVDGVRAKNSNKTCYPVNEQELCAGSLVAIKGQVLWIEYFMEDINGKIFTANIKGAEDRMVQELSIFKDFEALDLDAPTVSCAAGNVCIGDTTYVKELNSPILLFQEAVIVGFSKHGILTGSKESPQLVALAMNKNEFKSYKKNVPQSCNDMSYNHKKEILISFLDEKCATLISQGQADLCSYMGVPTPWDSNEIDEPGDKPNTCNIQGTMMAWVRSPFQK